MANAPRVASARPTSAETNLDPRRPYIERISADRSYGHSMLFRQRHPQETPPFHYEIMRHWHSMAIARLMILAFRGGAKSTLAEEALVIGALLGDFRNAVIIGENEARAADRLNAIKDQLTNNEVVTSLFGDVVGDTWGYSKITLKSGVVIQALGRRMEVRGMKHLDIRPDLLFGDDLEADEHVKDANARHETLRWLFAEVIPALDKNARIRLQATPLDREALPMRIKNEMPDWKTLTYPIRFKDQQTGDWKATWPSRYDLDWIEKEEKRLYKLGLHHDFMREYMCEAEDPAKKIFTVKMFNVVPRVHVWQPCFAMIDPARTTNNRSASTGWAVWSWIGERLIVWDGGGEMLLPDQIIKLIFDIHLKYHPVAIGVERDGLEEFIMQPLRNEVLRRNVPIKIEPMKAPKGKESFIEGLQPLFNSGTVELAKDMPELVAQFLSYPTGRIDAPNALAYAPKLRPGQPIFESFGHQHVVESVLKWEKVPFWLCLNATPARTTGMLVQLCDGAIHVLADYVALGDPGANIEAMVRNASLDAGVPPRCIGGPGHFGSFDVVGLAPAVRTLPAEFYRGGEPLDGRGVIRDLLERSHKGVPMVRVAQTATWTVNAFACGYAREATPSGELRQQPPDGVYATLMGGLEAFAALLKTGMLEPDRGANWSVDQRTGKVYKSIMPSAGPLNPDKSEWHTFGKDRRNTPETILPAGHPMRNRR